MQIDKELAINPGQVFGKIAGAATTDPAFGLEAYWIDKAQHEEAQMLGYTVVDPGDGRGDPPEPGPQGQCAKICLGHEETQQLLDQALRHQRPSWLRTLTPKTSAR